MVDPIFSNFELVVNYIGTIAIFMIAVILLIKIIKYKKEIREINIIQCLILGIFLSFSWALFWVLLYESTPYGANMSEEVYVAPDTFSFYNFGVGLMVTFALTMVFYYNEWKKLYYIPFIIFFAMFFAFLLTRFDALLLIYIYVVAVLVLVLMYSTSFKLKDNNLLGLCVFFTLTLFTNILEGIEGTSAVGQAFNMTSLIFKLIYSAFGIFFALGYFKVFKEVLA